MSFGAMVLRSVWRRGSDFLDNYIEGDPPRFFHPIPGERDLPPEAAVGALLSVVVVIEDRDTEVHLHARVIDRRTGTQKHGLTLEVLPEERERVELVLVAARGESLPYRRRRHQRVPCQLACRITATDGRTFTGQTTNLNEGGLHAAVDPELEPNEEVSIRLTLPEKRRKELRGRVVDVIPEGPQRGVGIEFLFTSAEERDELHGEVGRLRTRASDS